MALEQKLELKMMQKLILTPQLQQAIKLLQMPQLELAQNLNQELVENPFLEEVADDTPEEPEPEAFPEEQPFAAEEKAEVPIEQLLGFSVNEYFDSRSYDGRDLGYFSPDVGQDHNMEQYVSQGTDL